MGVAIRVGISVVLTLAACGGPAAVTSAPEEPESGPTEKASGPTASQAEPTTEPVANMGTAIRVERDHLLVDGVRIERGADGKVEMVRALFDTLRGRQGRDTSTGAPTLIPGSQRPYELQVGDDAPMAWFKSAFQTAGFAGQGPATLSVRGQSFLLRPLVPLPPTAAAEDSGPPFPDPSLIVTVRKDVTELWRAPQPRVPNELPPAAERVSQLASSATSSELEAAFNRQCAQVTCSPAVIYTSDDIQFSRVGPVLGAFASAARAGQTNPLIELRVTPPPHQPTAPGPINRVRLGDTTVSGKLAPELIRSTVRANYDGPRKCYEAGLKKDPGLKGRLSVRFVIARDGTVPSARIEDNDLPEVVSQCVLAEFQRLVFPHPEGGIVTVVYPIKFQPE